MGEWEGTTADKNGDIIVELEFCLTEENDAWSMAAAVTEDLQRA